MPCPKLAFLIVMAFFSVLWWLKKEEKAAHGFNRGGGWWAATVFNRFNGLHILAQYQVAETSHEIFRRENKGRVASS
jgi:hypothetical protein